ncbi:thermonuclease family protein [Candidatus Pacearchaeota archaeon]|nr:thermonuclease family protein [Candidatus Pacearchaeota archaeon]
MDKKYSFIIAIIITGLIASSLFVLSSISKSSENRTLITVARVIDGDTLVTAEGQTVRLLNINAPEKSSSLHLLSKNYLNSFVNKTLEMEISGSDKYHRLLVRLYSSEYINKNLVENGMASKFLVSESELTSFSEAENKAINEGRGIWSHSSYYGCFSTHINKNEEFVVIENLCPQINMNLWMLKDESRKTYIFRNITLQESESLTLFTSEGKDKGKDVFWNSKTNIWNNDRDTLYLFDKEGKIAHHETYGY